MDGLALYLFKTAICSAIFLGIYLGFLKNQTFFRFNRYYLLTGILLALLLPLYTHTYQVSLTPGELPAMSSGQTVGQLTENYWPSVMLSAYAVGIVFLLSRYAAGLFKIKALIERTGFARHRGYRLVAQQEFSASFSAFNYIFIHERQGLSQTERQLILAHEIAHVRQYHWADLLLGQLFCTLLWFNPLVWIYQKAIRENHEYLADRAVLQQGTSTAEYRAALVNQCIGLQVFSFSSSFHKYPSPRLSMLSRPASKAINRAVVLLALPAIALFYSSFSKAVVSIRPYLANPVGSSAVNAPDSILRAKDAPKTRQKNKGQTLSASSKATKKAIQSDTASTWPAPIPSAITASTHPIQPLLLIDGQEVATSFDDIDQSNIAEVRVLKDQAAVKEFGERGRNGVVMLYTKTQAKNTLK